MLDSVAAADHSWDDYNILKREEAPTDTISCITWSPYPHLPILACSDWDSKIRIYALDIERRGILQQAIYELDEPSLSVSWADDMSKLYAGSIDNTLKVFDVATGKPQSIGQHDAAVKDVYWVQNFGVVCSLSHDKTVKFWDLRQQAPAVTCHLGYKIYCSDLVFPYLAVGLQDERIVLSSLHDLHATNQTHMIESPLGRGSQLTNISFFADGSGVGMCTNDGRANISNFTERSGRLGLSNVMTFKAHKSDQPKILYPVHGIGFNSRAKEFIYTAGGEGIIYFWDYQKKNKITTLSFQGVPVTKTKTSPSGEFLAYALGYDWAKGIEGTKSMKTRLCVHRVMDNELRYRH